MKKHKHEIMNHEYLMSNGLGGYSFGTLDQVNCRKYHSLYTVSFNPPIERMHMISKISEVVLTDQGEFPIAYENVTGVDMTESNLVSYEHEGTICQTFEIKPIGVIVKRILAMAYGTNQLAVKYIIETLNAMSIKMTPWFNFRDHHDTISAVALDYQAVYDEQHQLLSVTAKDKTVFMKAETSQNAAFLSLPDVYDTPICHYPIETQRGYPDEESHVVLGHFVFDLPSGVSEISFLVNLSPEFDTAEHIFEGRKNRYAQLMKLAKADVLDPSHSPSDPYRRLVQAADDFIVYRKTTGKMTILAGYPWFSDWGRDTMIAIPGLTLETGRSEEALQMIEGFLEMSHLGIIPNNFPDEGQAPMYNTSDGTLWLFNAMYMYYLKTGDKDAVERLYPKLMEILNHHIQGTINDIYMDTDGLLSSGNEDTQLTWMDVKVNGWVVTPRHGKAVEINALWYNALSVMDAFTDLLKVHNEAMGVDLKALMHQVKTSFNQQFWNEQDQNLFDLIIDGVPVDIPRPNMIFSVSLPFAVLEEKRWKPVVNYVEKHFKVPYGLLTLRREDENFHKKYEGDLLSRDGAYHRGTAWGWLIGPFLEAHYKTYHDTTYLKTSLEALFKHLDEGIHGSISEIFEGGEPHAQVGCSAQAWSVAEAIRLWKLALE